MQFRKDGPEIPDKILNSHEDQSLVLFCGAGVSVDAGLPNFKDLVTEVLKRSGIAAPQEFHDAFKAGQYDFALSILERETERKSSKIRKIVAELLSKRPKHLHRHKTILRLAKVEENWFRLVTTNFDRLFLKASGSRRTVVDVYPGLPSPKRTRWQSIVHLHGIVPESWSKAKDHDFFRLVMASGDFGEAYLTDANCSRFLVELIRNFQVVFVGYSVNDPVLRYLLDAIAVAESRDESSFIQPFAFVPCFNADKEQTERAWRQRSVNAIVYDVGPDNSHRLLFDTLEAWADLSEQGQRGRATMALAEAQKPFVAQDSFAIERMLWALSEANGRAAKALFEAERGDSADEGWLSVFAANGLLDLYEGETTESGASKERRPRIERAYRGSITTPPSRGKLHPISNFLVKWIIKNHLDKVQTIRWVLENGGWLSDEFCVEFLIAERTGQLAYLSQSDLKLWKVLTSAAYRTTALAHRDENFLIGDPDLSTYSAKVQFLRIVSPRLILRFSGLRGKDEVDLVSKLDVEVAFRGVHWGSTLLTWFEDVNFVRALADLALPLTAKLYDSMQMLASLDRAGPDFDTTAFRLPSISDHDQNEYPDDLGVLILVIRKGFDQVVLENPNRAIAIAQQWKAIKFPVFQRLFFYAAEKLSPALDEDAKNLLLEDNAKLLWANPYAQREVKRYLRHRLRSWPEALLSEFVEVVRSGPERSQFKTMGDQEWEKYSTRLKARLFLKLEQAGIDIPQRDREFVASTGLVLPEDHSDEFLMFSVSNSSGFWEEREEEQFRELLELTTDERLQWSWRDLDANQALRFLMERRPAEFDQLVEAAFASIEPHADFFSSLMTVLASQIRASRSDDSPEIEIQNEERQLFELGERILQNLNEDILADSLAASSAMELWDCLVPQLKAKGTYLAIWDRIWNGVSDLAPDGANAYDRLTDALNKPSGKLVERVIRDYWPSEAKRNSKLPEVMKERLTACLDAPNEREIRCSTVMIAASLQLLHAVDPKWAQQYLLPYMNWSLENAATVWTSFFWRARIDLELYEKFSEQFLETANHRTELEPRTFEIFLHMCVISALDYDAVSGPRLREILVRLPPEVASEVPNYLLRRMKNTQQKADVFWDQAIKPLLETAWPQNGANQSESSKEAFAQMCLFADERFPDALAWLLERDLIGRVAGSSSLNFLFRSDNRHPTIQSQISDYPRDVVRLLNVTRPVSYSAETLRAVLQECIEVDPTLQADDNFVALNEFLDLNA